MKTRGKKETFLPLCKCAFRCEVGGVGGGRGSQVSYEIIQFSSQHVAF